MYITEPGIKITLGWGRGLDQSGPKGFHMTFSNGFTASVQFGEGNYCENKDGDKSESKNAEVALWPGGKDLEEGARLFTMVYPEVNLFPEYDSVRGYLSMEEVARFLYLVSKMPYCS